MNWGKSIFLAFALFAAFIGALVVVCVRQDIPLVATNYYEQELKYQEQLDRLKNTEALIEKPEIRIIDGAVELRYGQMTAVTHGELELFRPSDARLDKKFTINPSETILRFQLNNMPGGMYKARLRWTQGGKEHFLERTIYL